MKPSPLGSGEGGGSLNKDVSKSEGRTDGDGARERKALLSSKLLRTTKPKLF